MLEDHYFGAYARFETVSKREAGPLLGPDNLIGDRYEIVLKKENGTTRAWLKNRFGKEVGYFDHSTTRQISLCQAKGWVLSAFLSFVAFTDRPDPGHYWGEAAIVCYHPMDRKLFDAFCSNVAKRMADGIRPDVDLEKTGFLKIEEHDGNWSPSKTVPYPPKEEGTAIIKKHQKMSEKMIEHGRAGNKGCYLISWAFLLAIIALAAFGLKSIGVF